MKTNVSKMDTTQGLSSAVTMDINLGKQPEVPTGMPAAVQRSSSLDSMQPPMIPPVTTNFPIPVPTCTQITNSLSNYTPAAVQRSRSLPLLDTAPELPPEILAEITERTAGTGNENASDSLTMDQNNAGRQGVGMMQRDYAVQDDQNSAGMTPNTGMGPNGGMGNAGAGVVPQSPGLVPQSPGMVPQSPGMVPQSPGMVPQSPTINNQGVVQSPGIQSPGIPSPGMQPLNLSQSASDGNKQLLHVHQAFFPPSGPGVVGRPSRQARNYMPPISEISYQTTRFPFRPTDPPISYGFPPQTTSNLGLPNATHAGKIEGYGFLSGENAPQLINVSQGMGGSFLRPPQMFITRPIKETDQKVAQRSLGVPVPVDQNDNNNDKSSPNMQVISENVSGHLSVDKGMLPLSVNVSTAFSDQHQENSPASLSRQSNSPALLRFKALASDQMLSMLNYNEEQLLQEGGLITDDNFLIPPGQRLQEAPNLPGMDSNPASVNNEPFDLFESNPGEVDDTPNYMADSLSPPQPLSVDSEAVTSLANISTTTGSDSTSMANSSRVVVTRDGASVVVSNQISVQGK